VSIERHDHRFRRPARKSVRSVWRFVRRRQGARSDPKALTSGPDAYAQIGGNPISTRNRWGYWSTDLLGQPQVSQTERSRVIDYKQDKGQSCQVKSTGARWL